MIHIKFWQMAIARVTALFIGIVIGAYWHEIFSPQILPFAIVGVGGSLYVLYIVAKNYKR